jgi:hypothetical protein
VYLAIVHASLGVVKWTSISAGPSADDAIAAVRVAERDLARTRWLHGHSELSVLNAAEAALARAWSALEDRHYDEAIRAAELARQPLGRTVIKSVLVEGQVFARRARQE